MSTGTAKSTKRKSGSTKRKSNQSRSSRNSKDANWTTPSKNSSDFSADPDKQSAADGSNWMRGAIRPTSWKKMTQDERVFWYDVTFEVEAMHNDRRNSRTIVAKAGFFRRRILRKQRPKWERLQKKYEAVPATDKSEKSSSEEEDVPAEPVVIATAVDETPKPESSIKNAPKLEKPRFLKVQKFDVTNALPSGPPDEPTKSSNDSDSDRKKNDDKKSTPNQTRSREAASKENKKPPALQQKRDDLEI